MRVGALVETGVPGTGLSHPEPRHGRVDARADRELPVDFIRAPDASSTSVISRRRI